MSYIKGEKFSESYCIKLQTGETVYRITVNDCPDCNGDYESSYYTDELGNPIPDPDLTGAANCDGTLIDLTTQIQTNTANTVLGLQDVHQQLLDLNDLEDWEWGTGVINLTAGPPNNNVVLQQADNILSFSVTNLDGVGSIAVIGGLAGGISLPARVGTWTFGTNTKILGEDTTIVSNGSTVNIIFTRKL